jgi:hypothetical protein
MLLLFVSRKSVFWCGQAEPLAKSLAIANFRTHRQNAWSMGFCFGGLRADSFL